MYTQCPDCQTAFRVTAEVLQKAAGRVRCGGCGNAFSAIDFLSENLPNSANPAGTEDLDDKSKDLLQTLDDLAGTENVRIEDTGIEWRVLDEDEGAESEDEEIVFEDSGVVAAISEDHGPLAESGAQTFLDLQQLADGEPPVAERRYDDNTPLPDNFDDEEDRPYSPTIESSHRSNDDSTPDDSTDFDTHQIDLAMSADDDWAELLDAEADNAPVVSAGASEGHDDTQDRSGNSESPLTTELDYATAQQAAVDSATTNLNDAIARPAADDSALLPELAAELASNLSDTSRTSRSEIPLEVEEELAAIHSELAAGAAMISRDPATPAGAIDDGYPIDSTGDFDNEKTEDDAEAAMELSLDDAESDTDLETVVEDEAAADQIIAEPGDDDETAINLSLDDAAGEDGAEVDLYLDDTNDVDEEADTGIIDLSDEHDVDKEVHTGVIDMSDEHDDDEDFDFEDELTPDEEANIVEKLRESTGAFQKQIEAAREAMERGEPDKYSEPGYNLDDETDLELPDSHDDEISNESNSDDNELAAASVAEDAEPTADEILSQTMIQAGIDPSQLDSENAETIVMEGDFVRGSLDEQQLAEEQEALAQITDGDSLIDTYMLNKAKGGGGRRKTDPARYAMTAGIVVLVALLAVQYIHASRSDFATYGAFNQTIGPVYRAMGKPVTPEWDVKGWRFESTNGSIDEGQQVLTIVSAIGNASDEPLPYPLVHVSLTDRWEEIIGSKVLEPNEYLAGDLDPRKPVAPNDRFQAVIAIESPSADATGFKLNVCYRITPGRVRCATDDFKN